MKKTTPTYKITTAAEVVSILPRIGAMIRKGIEAGPVIVMLTRESKSREQEAKYHVMIADVARTVEFDGKTFEPDVWKALLVDQFEQEMAQNQHPLTNPSKVVISLDQRRVVSVRASTTQFRKAEASMFIEFLYSFGIEHGATFSDKSLAIYDEYCRA